MAWIRSGNPVQMFTEMVSIVREGIIDGEVTNASIVKVLTPIDPNDPRQRHNQKAVLLTDETSDRPGNQIWLYLEVQFKDGGTFGCLTKDGERYSMNAETSMIGGVGGEGEGWTLHSPTDPMQFSHRVVQQIKEFIGKFLEKQ